MTKTIYLIQSCFVLLIVQSILNHKKCNCDQMFSIFLILKTLETITIEMIKQR